MNGIERHGNGYRYRLYLGIVDGKKKYQPSHVFPTKKEAEAALIKAKAELQNGTYVSPSRETVGVFFSQWLADKKLQVAPGTYRQYSWLIEEYVIQQLGNIKLQQLRPQHIQNLLNYAQTRAGLSRQSVKHLHSKIKQGLKRAQRWGLINRNVAELVEVPKVSPYQAKTWTEEQFSQFLQVAQHQTRYYTLFLLLLSTGMRLGEALGLKWSNVDLESGVIYVQRSLSSADKGYKMKSPKNDPSRRSIQLPSLLTEQLTQHKEIQTLEREEAGKQWHDNDLVICTKIGTPVLQSNIRTVFKRISERIGVPVIRVHDLRHTHATLLLKLGVPPKVIQERFGHKDIKTTMNIYSHVIPGMQQAAAEEFDNVLRSHEVNARRVPKTPQN